MPKQESVDSILQSTKINWPEAYDHISPSILKLLRAHHHIRTDLEELLGHYQIQGADFGILATLRRSGEPYCLSPTTLYHSLLFSSGGLTKVLNRMKQAELIERLDNPDDKRSKLVKLSPMGKELVDAIIVELHKNEQKKLAILSEDEIKQLDILLSKLLLSWN
ncbi:MarR family winged helix-turn-helix transcriptional regulator [Shewanella sp. 10N.286.52.A9]|uniref:MarR family winged helix-turn-helix transcriptional regulator n=1 Tax=Shewanella sp. 10N.286.52.A9 TaxID=3229711 RepID=UPI003550BD9E